MGHKYKIKLTVDYMTPIPAPVEAVMDEFKIGMFPVLRNLIVKYGQMFIDDLVIEEVEA